MTGVTREIAAMRDDLPCDSEPHGEEPAVMAAHEPNLGRAIPIGGRLPEHHRRTADSRRTPGEAVIAARRMNEVQEGLRAFFEAAGLRVPSPNKLALCAILLVGLIGRHDA